jgi:hypothetical protein
MIIISLLSCITRILSPVCKIISSVFNHKDRTHQLSPPYFFFILFLRMSPKPISVNVKIQKQDINIRKKYFDVRSYQTNIKTLNI